jgi:hypothetical protein
MTQHIHRYLVPAQPEPPLGRCLNTAGCDERYRLMSNVYGEGRSGWGRTTEAQVALSVQRGNRASNKVQGTKAKGRAT